MADEKAKDRDPGEDQEKGKTMGAGASGNYQGQQRQEDGRRSQPSETGGQGGGIQGTGQSQPNPGGYTQGRDQTRDQGRGSSPLSEEKKDRE